MEFHISRSARQRYQFPDTLFSWNGNVVFASMPACRAFAHRMNQVREADKHPDRAVHAGAIYAMGMIDEASHVLMARYRQQYDAQVLADALAFFGEQVGPEQVDKLLLAFVEYFPGSAIIRGDQTPQEWLAGSTMACPIARRRWKRCCCCGWPIAIPPSSHSRSCLKTGRWRSARFIAR